MITVHLAKRLNQINSEKKLKYFCFMTALNIAFIKKQPYSIVLSVTDIKLGRVFAYILTTFVQ